MASDRFTLLPIVYVALVLVVTNLIAFIAVTCLERCGYRRNMNIIDVMSTYVCFGICFVFVTVPTMAAPGVHPINQISAILIFLWSMLYMISLYFGIHDNLSTINETEWVQWVALSFLCLLPYTMGLSRLDQKKTNPSFLGLLLSTVGLLMLSLSSWRTWQHTIQHILDAERTLSPSMDSWWGNCVFWFGIFLLKSHATMTKPDEIARLRRGNHSRMTSMPLLLIVSFVFGPGFLFFSHPHIQRFLYNMFYLFLVGIQQPPNNAFGVSLVDPTLLRFVRSEREFTGIAVHRGFPAPIVDESSQVRVIETFEIADSRFPIEISNSLFLPGFSTDNNEKDPLLRVTSTDVFASKIEIGSEQPVVRRIEKPAASFKMFLSKFKLKITTDILRGHWN
jgi:hypothetical protein